MNLLIDGSLQSDYFRRVEVTPTAYVGEIAQQVIEVRRKFFVHGEALLDKLLTPPLAMLITLRDPMDVYPHAREC